MKVSKTKNNQLKQPIDITELKSRLISLRPDLAKDIDQLNKEVEKIIQSTGKERGQVLLEQVMSQFEKENADLNEEIKNMQILIREINRKKGVKK